MFEHEYPYRGNGNIEPVPQASRTIRPALLDPQISLFGGVCDDMFQSFKQQLRKALDGYSEIAVELSTNGGDADTARRIADEVRLCREYRGRELLFVGKSFVYSAGITIMSGFEKECRYLTKDCHLLIHSRRLDKHVHFSGPLSSNVQIAEEMLAQLKSGLDLENEGFRRLAAGSNIGFAEIQKRAAHNWYLRAEEALELGLVEGLV